MTAVHLPAKPLNPVRPRRRLARLGIMLAEINDPIAALGTFDICAMVTLVLLFLYAGTQWYLMVPMRAMCLCAIFISKLRHSPYLWYSVLMALVAANYYDRLLIDNHKYLMTYWILAFVLASLNGDDAGRDRVLSINGRMLIGLCFFFAVVAKLMSADYLSGGFFRYTLLLDPRFAHFTWLAGGVAPAALVEAKRASHDLRTAYLLNIDLAQVPLISSPRLSALTWFMTIWTLFIESTIAIAFLCPGRSGILEWGRRYLLWIFLVSTYSVALVSGFAWTLTVMGLAQLPKAHSKFRIVYILLVAVVLQLYEVHYVSLITSLVKYLHDK